jgi:hypothetical protein
MHRRERFAMAIIPSVKSKARRFNHATLLRLTIAWRVPKSGANIRTPCLLALGFGYCGAGTCLELGANGSDRHTAKATRLTQKRHSDPTRTGIRYCELGELASALAFNEQEEMMLTA